MRSLAQYASPGLLTQSRLRNYYDASSVRPGGHALRHLPQDP